MKHKSFKALLADPPIEDVSNMLSALNVEVVTYSAAERHEEAWSLLARRRSLRTDTRENYSESRLRQTLAAVLTHIRLQRQTDLRLSVVAAAALASIEVSGGGAIEDVYESVRRDLALPPTELQLIKTAVGILRDSGKVHAIDGMISMPTPAAHATPASQDLERIIRGVLARAAARYGIKVDGKYDYYVALREVFLLGGFSLGMVCSSLILSFAARTEIKLGSRS